MWVELGATQFAKQIFERAEKTIEIGDVQTIQELGNPGARDSALCMVEDKDRYNELLAQAIRLGKKPSSWISPLNSSLKGKRTC